MTIARKGGASTPSLFQEVTGFGHDQVSTYMKEEKKFAESQHAFLKMHSTLTLLLNITDSWFSNIDKRRINISVFLDLTKRLIR